MSAFKGTPGPWEVVNGTDVFTHLGGRNASGVAASKSDGWHVADCNMGPSFTEEGKAGIPHAEKRANARLIAAAPELLEVAQRSAAALRSGGIEPIATSDNPLEWLLHQTEAAIAKATGEQS